jgi:hypothetical protein
VSFEFENTEESLDPKLFSEVYDFCMRLSNMQKVLSTFQDLASKANREETRALILASKKSVKTPNAAVKPANSALRLLHKVVEEVRAWLNARGYLSATAKVPPCRSTN